MVNEKTVRRYINRYVSILRRRDQWHLHDNVFCDELRSAMRPDTTIRVRDQVIHSGDAERLLSSNPDRTHVILIDIKDAQAPHLSTHYMSIVFTPERYAYVIDPEYPVIKDEIPQLSAIEDALAGIFTGYQLLRGDHLYGGWKVVPEGQPMMWQEYADDSDRNLPELHHTPPQMLENLWLYEETGNPELAGMGTCILWNYVIIDHIMMERPLPETGLDAWETITAYIDNLADSAK